MPSLDALCLRLTGQTLEVVQHQLMAIRANVWSWLLVTLKIRKPRLQLADCDSKARCIVVLSPGGPERLEFWPLDGRLATVGYNVPESVAPRDPRSRSLTRVATAPPPGLVVVRITHFSVNYADVTIRWGLYESAIKFVGYPIVPGFDFSGIVEAVAAGVDNLRAGDAVFGITFFGAYSSRLLVPASQCRKTPKALSAAEAAALPSVAGTALHAMALAQFWPAAPPTRNRAVLVHSAAGGVGSMLVQMAKTLGCAPVVGVVGAAHKIEACEACGADTVVCKAGRSDWWDDVAAASPDGYAAIFDANGVATCVKIKVLRRAEHPTHWLISTGRYVTPVVRRPRADGPPRDLRLPYKSPDGLVDVEPAALAPDGERHCVDADVRAHGPRAVLQVDPRLQPIVCVRRPLFFVFASMAWRWTRRRDASQVLRRRDGFGRRVHGAAPRVGGRGPTPRRARRDFWIRGTAGGARADPGRPVRREDRL